VDLSTGGFLRNDVNDELTEETTRKKEGVKYFSMKLNSKETDWIYVTSRNCFTIYLKTRTTRELVKLSVEVQLNKIFYSICVFEMPQTDFVG
jgi:hypothetical protein